MKKSKEVPATLLAAVAALALAGCSRRTQVQRCIDASGNVLPDYVCSSGNGYYGGRYYSTPHWIYGGSMSGGRVYGNYQTTPMSGADITNSQGQSVSRGGFGSSGSSSSG